MARVAFEPKKKLQFFPHSPTLPWYWHAQSFVLGPRMDHTLPPFPTTMPQSTTGGEPGLQATFSMDSVREGLPSFRATRSPVSSRERKCTVYGHEKHSQLEDKQILLLWQVFFYSGTFFWEKASNEPRKHPSLRAAYSQPKPLALPFP